MKPFAILLVAGDPSGDLAAAELVRALGRAAVRSRRDASAPADRPWPLRG